MSEEDTNTDIERPRAVPPTWHYGELHSAAQVKGWLNNPFPLPPGAVAVVADGNRFHFFWLGQEQE